MFLKMFSQTKNRIIKRPQNNSTTVRTKKKSNEGRHKTGGLKEDLVSCLKGVKDTLLTKRNSIFIYFFSHFEGKILLPIRVFQTFPRTVSLIASSLKLLTCSSSSFFSHISHCAPNCNTWKRIAFNASSDFVEFSFTSKAMRMKNCKNGN